MFKVFILSISEQFLWDQQKKKLSLNVVFPSLNNHHIKFKYLEENWKHLILVNFNDKTKSLWHIARCDHSWASGYPGLHSHVLAPQWSKAILPIPLCTNIPQAKRYNFLKRKIQMIKNRNNGWVGEAMYPNYWVRKNMVNLKPKVQRAGEIQITGVQVTKTHALFNTESRVSPLGIGPLEVFKGPDFEFQRHWERTGYKRWSASHSYTRQTDILPWDRTKVHLILNRMLLNINFLGDQQCMENGPMGLPKTSRCSKPILPTWVWLQNPHGRREMIPTSCPQTSSGELHMLGHKQVSIVVYGKITNSSIPVE